MNQSSLHTRSRTKTGHGFGTAPVFLASISTILGAVLFLRFGYAVGHSGMLGALFIIILGHAVTVPTALAVAEIATNRRVEGGGEYYIISRSFGATIGGTIGIALYLSQAISVAFYVIAFAEAFRPLSAAFESLSGLSFDPRIVSIPAILGLAVLVLSRGADFGVKALWGVAGVLAVSLLLFFLGAPPAGVQITEMKLFETVEDPDSFMFVFSIVFPAFTGMTAGVGLSGDLVNPRKSIPLGILSATVVGLIVYVATAVKLASSTTPQMLAEDQLVMQQIALWGPIVPIGLACAAISSAIGSILVAPRTLQALAVDRVVPFKPVTRFLAFGAGEKNEPRNATLVTSILAVFTVAVGNVDFVARIISMFFMVTYGSLCAISFLEHFASRPSFRPSFRSKWYVSLIGAVMCLFLMFQMDPLYAILAVLIVSILYKGIAAARDREGDLASMFQGAMTQATRYLQIKLQRRKIGPRSEEWRPSIIMVNGRTFSHAAPLQLFGWLCHRYGFGTYLHYMQGQLDAQSYKESRKVLSRLISITELQHSDLYVDTMISPSVRSALSQTLQAPGVSGMENNSILFEFSMSDPPETLAEAQQGCLIASDVQMNSLVLRHGQQFFGSKANLHIWLTWHDYKNANLMILLAYILLGHPDWREAEINIFAAFPHSEVEEQRVKLHTMIEAGRLPISRKNLRIYPTDERVNFKSLVEKQSSSADLVILGFTDERLREKGIELFLRHPSLRDVLFVSAEQRILIE
jgi:amino acid transporter